MKKSRYDRYANFIKFYLSMLPRKTRNFLLEVNRNTPGKLGMIIRISLVKSIVKECGENVFIFPGVYILNSNNLSLGNNISIHPMTYIDARGGIRIHDNVSIAHSTTILSTSHNYSDLKVPIRNQGITSRETIINHNVWIGAKATILQGCFIESGCIIAANSVVTKSFPPNVVLGGLPAKVLKERR
ncbi:acyltransferase [Planococcus plakortidis]